MFSPLQVLSENSLLKSDLRIEAYVKKAADLGYQTLVLSDLNVMYGVLDFYHACQKYHIKPVVGITLEVEASSSLVLLAKNEQGYRNLLQISSLKLTRFKDSELAFSEFLDQISPYLTDLNIIAPPTESLLAKYYDNATEILKQLKEYADPNSVYLGIEPTLAKKEQLALTMLSKLSQTPLLATSVVHYLTADEYFEVKVLRAIASGEKLSFESSLKAQIGRHYLKEPSQYQIEYQNAGLQDAFSNAEKLLAESQLHLEFSKTKLPHFETPNGLSAVSYLQKLCQEGLNERLRIEQVSTREPYEKRLKKELTLIEQLGFADYFLIVWDVTNFAHEKKIRIGPGRGSAAGSLVAYVLKITDVDPLKYGLLFERFLNPKRAQMPDIDLDIPDTKRESLIRYVHQKYGHTHMAQIITFGTLGARQAIRDVGRVMGLTSFELDEWSQALPHRYKLTLREAYQESQKVKNLIADSPRNERLFKTALKLEGLKRHYSTHAAGILLSDRPLSESVPVQLGGDQILLSQFAKEQVEEVGLLKIDFLGLRNLTILDNALRFVKTGYGKRLDLRKISLDDPRTLRLFQLGQTNGIFQFESNGIQNVLRRLKPTSFEDVAAVNALYRPGPIRNIDEFIARKHGKKPVIYPEPSLRPILESTYGIMVYQEQVMQVASEMGGFSLGQADLLRRAISKKDQTKIDQLQTAFIAGAKQQGYAKEKAKRVYDYMKRFGNYGFNRSHAVAYSKMAFELAYLKSHYPAAFFAALLNSVIGNEAKLREYLGEIKRYGLTLKGPDINQSVLYFSLKEQTLIFGLGSIKTVRSDLLKAILNERQANGPYTSLVDLIKRIDKKFLKEEQLKALIYAGALDSLTKDRAKLIAQVPLLLSNIALSGDNQTLFEKLAPKEQAEIPEISEKELLAKEAYYLGTYLSKHPVEKYAWLAKRKQAKLLNAIVPGTRMKVLVYIDKVRVIRTKKGEQMAFVKVGDQSAEGELVVFPEEYRRFSELLQVDECVLVEGKVEMRNDQKNIIVTKLALATSFSKQCYYLRLDATATLEKRKQLQTLIQKNQGNVPVILIETNEKKKIILKENMWLNNTPETKEALTTLLGSKNVVLK